jgi:hypothetical protein
MPKEGGHVATMAVKKRNNKQKNKKKYSLQKARHLSSITDRSSRWEVSISQEALKKSIASA